MQEERQDEVDEEEDRSVEEVYEEDFDVPVQKASPPAAAQKSRRDTQTPSLQTPAPAPAVHVNAFKTAEFHNIYRALYKDCPSLSAAVRAAQLSNLLTLLCYSPAEIGCLLGSTGPPLDDAAATTRTQSHLPNPNLVQKQTKPSPGAASSSPPPPRDRDRDKMLPPPQTLTQTQQRPPSRDKQQQQRDIPGQQQQLHKQLAADEKERRRAEGVAKAALELEQQAAVRKARQDAAREKLQQTKTRPAPSASSSSSSSPSTAAAPSSSDGPAGTSAHANTGRPAADGAAERQKLKQLRDQVAQVERQKLSDPLSSSSSSSSSDPKVAFHEAELCRLLAELEADGQLSAAAIHGIRKNIAVHKASLARERQRAAERSQSALQVRSACAHSDPHQATSHAAGYHEHRPIRSSSNSGGGGGGSADPGQSSSLSQQPGYHYYGAGTGSGAGGGGDGRDDWARGGQHARPDLGGRSHDTRSSPHNGAATAAAAASSSSLEGSSRAGSGSASASASASSFMDRERERERVRRLGAAAAPFCNDYSWQPDQS